MRLVAGAVLVVLLAACGSGSSRGPTGAATTPPPTVTGTSRATPTPSTTAPARPAATGPCGFLAGPARVDHVLWVWMENHSYAQIAGQRRAAPYLDRLAGQCGLATNYRSVAHPSLPNYLAAVSGTTGGVRSDCSPSSCPQHARTLFAQVAESGRQWRVYAESMPGACAHASTDRYAAKHNPAVYYPAIAADCRRWDLPLGTPSAGPLADAVRKGTLPAFTVVVPNICHDMHDCSRATGDRWLSQWLPTVFAGPTYRSGHLLVVVTFDEGEGTDHVATFVASAYTRPGTRASTRFTHYSLLRTTEDLLHLAHLDHAATATSMATAFGL